MADAGGDLTILAHLIEARRRELPDLDVLTFVSVSADGSFQERLYRLDKRVSVDVIRRRQVLLMRDLAVEPDYRACETGIRSLLVAPLRHEGQVMGTLGLYEKVAPDRFYPGTFHDEDLRVFTRYVTYLERAIANARSR